MSLLHPGGGRRTLDDTCICVTLDHPQQTLVTVWTVSCAGSSSGEVCGVTGRRCRWRVFGVCVLAASPFLCCHYLNLGDLTREPSCCSVSTSVSAAKLRSLNRFFQFRRSFAALRPQRLKSNVQYYDDVIVQFILKAFTPRVWPSLLIYQKVFIADLKHFYLVFIWLMNQ